MMQKIKDILVMLLAVLVCLQLCACQSSNGAEEKEQTIDNASGETTLEDVPKEYIDCLENFLDAMTTDTSKSAEYAYFPNETIRQAHKDSGVTLVSYTIKSVEKIGDKLYAFDLILEDTYHSGPYEQWKFVGEIDGEILAIGNVNYIPEELAPDLDKDKFEYKTDETLSPDDSIIFDLEG